MELKIDTDGLPECPDCGQSLSYEPSRGRDTETMGGHDVEYFKCENGCGGQFETINGPIYPSGNRMREHNAKQKGEV